MRDHSHRIDRSNRLKKDKSRQRNSQFKLNKMNSAEKLSIEFKRDKILAGRSFPNQFDRKYFQTPNDVVRSPDPLVEVSWGT